MEKHNNFSIGFFRTGQNEHMFLSVTPGFEHGPGILRDGITEPRMTDPHYVEYVRHAHHLPVKIYREHPYTNDAHRQRAGTWTLYQHVKRFLEKKGDQWQVVAVQSCGDLTMNPWHVAFLGNSHIPELCNKLCALRTEEDRRENQEEPVTNRVYRALVKWTPEAATVIGGTLPYVFMDICFSDTPRGYAVVPADVNVRKDYSEKLKALSSYDHTIQDISGMIDFCISGKPVTENGLELSLSNSIDRFQDVRHVFNLPTVPCRGIFRDQEVKMISFGEYQLFSNLNERRAALQSAVLIDLNVGDHVTVRWEDVRKVMLSRHFREVDESPTKRGQFRKYPNSNQVEIFFPHNVYPFGVIGLASEALVCLASGGLSGRVGNTLEGITRIMYDFFGCEDAMVLDEGYDTFQVINPHSAEGEYKYTNENILEALLRFTSGMLDQEMLIYNPHDNKGMKDWPLNIDIIKEVADDFKKLKLGEETPSDILIVRPHRSQMRSVIIFAAEKKSIKRDSKQGAAADARNCAGDLRR